MIRFPINFEPLICNVDPITLTGLALGALAGGGAAALSGGGGGGSSVATPIAPAPQAAAPAQQQAPMRNNQRPQQQSFVGASSVPSSDSGQKTLLGQ
jgi:hypothetical protein